MFRAKFGRALLPTPHLCLLVSQTYPEMEFWLVLVSRKSIFSDCHSSQPWFLTRIIGYLWGLSWTNQSFWTILLTLNLPDSHQFLHHLKLYHSLSRLFRYLPGLFIFEYLELASNYLIHLPYWNPLTPIYFLVCLTLFQSVTIRAAHTDSFRP